MRYRMFVIAAVAAWAELLQACMASSDRFDVLGTASDGNEALAQLDRLSPPPDVVVIDVNALSALTVAATVRARDPRIRLVAVGLRDDPPHVLSWAVVGATALVAGDASLAHLLRTLNAVARGEAPCSPELTSALLQGVGASGTISRDGKRHMPLTGREREVAELVAEGLSNKEIACCLHIEPGTVKSHVHNIICKLGISRRAQVAVVLPRHAMIAGWHR